MSPPVELHRHPVDKVEFPNPESPNPKSPKIWQKNAVNRFRDPRDSTDDRPDLAKLNRYVWHFKLNQENQLIMQHGMIPTQWNRTRDQGFFLHPSHAKWQPVTVNLCSQPVKRHAKIWLARQKTDDVKIGRHMKGWTLCQNKNTARDHSSV